MEKNMFDSIIGKGLGPRRMDYTWRDVVLYALGVGAHPDDLPYIYEKAGLKALPTFGLLPYLNSILMQPQRRVPYAPNEVIGDLIIEKLGGNIPNRLHMGMELVVHGAINPMQGTFLTEDMVENVYDWSEKGIVGKTRMEVYDIAGNRICTLKSTHFHGAFGGYGGEPYRSSKLTYPDRNPDYTLNDRIGENQAILYRLLGDTYDVHIDPAVAQSYGYKGPFLQGLCTYGFAARMGIQAIIPYEPERVTRIDAQIRNICYPGQNVKFVGWKAEEERKEGKVYFRLLNEEGKALLDNGILEYK
jgi:hypothetical protein